MSIHFWGKQINIKIMPLCNTFTQLAKCDILERRKLKKSFHAWIFYMCVYKNVWVCAMGGGRLPWSPLPCIHLLDILDYIGHFLKQIWATLPADYFLEKESTEIRLKGPTSGEFFCQLKTILASRTLIWSRRFTIKILQFVLWTVQWNYSMLDLILLKRSVPSSSNRKTRF